MAQAPAALAPALDLYRRGDLAGARAAVETALRDEPKAPPLLALAGLIAAQMGDSAGAIPHFEALLAIDPNDLATRINLATALVAENRLGDAADVCEAGGRDPRLLRLLAYVRQQQGRFDGAASAYQAVVASLPDDFQSWNNLGNTRVSAGDLQGAIGAFERAVRLRPGVPEIYVNYSEVLAKAERYEARQTLMREAARLLPEHADIQAELGLAEASMRDFDAAIAAYREAIRIGPGFNQAWLELGLTYENLNRIDDLEALVAESEERGLAEPELDFLKAWTLRRRGKFEEALPLAEATPKTIHPVRRARLIAEIYDRLGDEEGAFAAFEEMNAASLETALPGQVPTYREMVVAAAALMTPERVADWTEVEVSHDPPSPAFIVGFPRSGTTLLDTLLMNMPSLHVLEELPVLNQVHDSLGDPEKLASLTSEEANRLRALYFRTLQGLSPPEPGQRVVDKYPLHMAWMPLINRIFPDSKIIFVERHPCDVVLSCLMASFQLNHAMRSFTTLEEAALTYDAVLDSWTRAETLLPLDVHRIRYERMVEDLEGEMRALLGFLGLPWDPKVLDNRGAAAKRDHIRTASYSQVSEPIYKRASGRWERYRKQLEPVLPILAPWAERMGYPI
jgi:tetratricopeptide (TPR) repeat protein